MVTMAICVKGQYNGWNRKKIIREIRHASLLFEDKAKENGINPYYAEMITNRLNELGRPDKKISVEETIEEKKERQL